MIENNVLRITSTFGKVGLKFTKPEVRTGYIPAKLEISTTKPVIRTSGGKITLNIDGSECKAEEGLKSAERLSSDFAQSCRDDARQAAQQATNEGYELLTQLPQNKNAVAEMEKSKILDNSYTLELIAIPSQPPKFSFDVEPLHTEVTQGSTSINWSTTSMTHAEVKPGSCEMYLEKAPSINIEYVGHALDQKA